MFTQTKIIVLRTVKYAENGIIVNAYAERFGRMAFAVKLPKTHKGKMTAAYFLPLTIIEVEVDYRENKELQHIKDCRVALPFESIPYDSVKNSLVYLVAEVLGKALYESVANEPLFTFLEKTLSFLDATEENCANFHLLFLLRLADFLGFRLNDESFTLRSYFDLQSGRFETQKPLHSDVLTIAESELLHQLMGHSFATMHTIKLNGKERRRLLEALLKFYKIHVPDFGTLRTLEVLNAIFNE